MRIGYALLLLIGASGAVAHAAPPPVAVEAPDPARLAAAKAMMDLMLPPERRDALIRGMIEPIVANVRSGFESSPQFAKVLTDNPKARALMVDFVDRQMRTSLDMTMESMPALIDAMAISYARQFTVPQIEEISGFYRTPTGQALVTAMPSLMSSPEIATVQRSMMSKALERVKADTVALAQQFAALEAENGKAKP